MEAIAKKKYQDLLKRSFERTLDLLILDIILKERDEEKVKNGISLSSFTIFLEELKSESIIKNDLIEKDRKSRQCCKGDEEFEGIAVKRIDNIFKDWYKENTTLEYFNIFKQGFINEVDFIKFYGDKNTERKCSYCGISEKQIEELFKAGAIKTKRWSTRGKTMEVDRIRPNDDYQLDNIVLSCYWCNNSKTDEYSQEEFCLIQNGITMVWNQRLKEIGKEPISK